MEWCHWGWCYRHFCGVINSPLISNCRSLKCDLKSRWNWAMATWLVLRGALGDVIDDVPAKTTTKSLSVINIRTLNLIRNVTEPFDLMQTIFDRFLCIWPSCFWVKESNQHQWELNIKHNILVPVYVLLSQVQSIHVTRIKWANKNMLKPSDIRYFFFLFSFPLSLSLRFHTSFTTISDARTFDRK